MISMTWPQYLRRECTLAGSQTVKLSRQQAEALFCLLARKPEPVTGRDILEMVYPNPDLEPEWAENSIRVMVLRLRHKIGKGRIVHHSGGYRLA